MKTYLRSARNREAAVMCSVICADVSASQDFTDLKPSRLMAAKAAITALIEVLWAQFPRDHLGLVSFSHTATVLHPLSEVGQSSRSLVRATQKLRAGGSTNISAGLETASRLLGATLQNRVAGAGRLRDMIRRLLFDDDIARPAPARVPSGCGRRIILTSDGCHNAGERNPVSVACKLKSQGIQIDVIGVGGSPTARQFDEEELKQIASRNLDGSPRYWFISDTEALIKRFESLAGHIRPLRATTGEGAQA